MHTPDERLAMLAERLAEPDPTRAAVEAVLLRSAFERLDDFLVWLDGHVATDHGDDGSATAVLQMLGGVRHRMTRELRLVDTALDRVEP